MRRARFLLAAVALVGACLTPAYRDDRLFDEWRVRTVDLRELAFTERVEIEWISQARVPELTGDEMMRNLPPGYAEKYRDVYSVLGLLPERLDLLQTLLGLHEEQLIGLYSIHDRTMYVVREHAGSADTPAEATVVHEMVHALQHQHFPHVMDILQGLRRNDDVVSSIGAAIEGDASLTMLAATPGSPLRRDMASAISLRDAMLFELMQPSGRMRDAPRLLRASLIFPYAYGAALAGRSYAAAGNAGLDALVSDPPLSTLRAMDPNERDPVDFIELPERFDAELEARGCERQLDNVAGALTLDVLFEEFDGGENLGELLRGWAGDRFVHVQCGEERELAWITRWDDAGAARRFAERYALIAPAVASAGVLGGTPLVHTDDRTAVVVTPRLAGLTRLLRDESEIRAYDTFGAWVADGCFPESPCPEEEAPEPAAPTAEDAAAR